MSFSWKGLLGVGSSSGSSATAAAGLGYGFNGGNSAVFGGSEGHRFTSGSHGFGPDSFEEDIPLFGLENVRHSGSSSV